MAILQISSMPISPNRSLGPLCAYQHPICPLPSRLSVTMAPPLSPFNEKKYAQKTKAVFHHNANDRFGLKIGRRCAPQTERKICGHLLQDEWLLVDSRDFSEDFSKSHVGQDQDCSTNPIIVTCPDISFRAIAYSFHRAIIILIGYAFDVQEGLCPFALAQPLHLC